MSRVKDILPQRELFYVEESQSVADVVRHMSDLNVGAIMVLKNGELCGVFSERDLMTRVVLPNRNPASTPVNSVMTTDVATIEESATAEEAMECMGVNKCRHLPVTSEGRLVGFLSMRDLMNHELAQKTEELHHMRAYIHGNT